MTCWKTGGFNAKNYHIDVVVHSPGLEYEARLEHGDLIKTVGGFESIVQPVAASLLMPSRKLLNLAFRVVPRFTPALNQSPDFAV